MFYVNKLFDHPIGARVVLPDHILSGTSKNLELFWLEW
jgi:hypothetical protein